ncbi:hypothetical protein MTO96_037569 [Rhipicephalus appendiculatus]
MVPELRSRSSTSFTPNFDFGGDRRSPAWPVINRGDLRKLCGRKRPALAIVSDERVARGEAVAWVVAAAADMCMDPV